MSDTSAAARIEPILDTGSPTPNPAPAPPPFQPEIVVPDTPPAPQPLRIEPARAPALAPDRASFDQLARIEDKISRVEEKFARSESMMLRVGDKVELATARMGEVAMQADLTALKGEVASIARRTRGLPGLTALVATAVVGALLSALFIVLILRFAPGLLPR
jgi:hypothetical protein